MRRLIFLIALSLVCVSSNEELGLGLDAHAVEVAGLKDQLEKGLKARRPQEFAFVGTVVALVENGTLSRNLVMSTFQWARKQQKYRRYIFPRFEAALRRLALEKEGVTIP